MATENLDTEIEGTDTPTPSIEETIRNTYRSIQESDETEESDTDVGADTDTDVKADTGRDEHGRFKKTAKTDAAPAGEQIADEQSAAAPAVTEAAQVADTEKLPASWSPKMAQEWAALPPTIRAQVHKREQDFHNGVKVYKDAAGFGGQVAEEFRPYMQTIQQSGQNPVQVVRNLLSYANTLSSGTPEQKVALLSALAKNNGVDLAALTGAAPAQDGGQAGVADPRVDRVIGYLNSQHQQQVQKQYQGIQGEVQTFAQSPGHEHYDAVKDMMADLIETGRAKDLQEAYDMAVWGNPSTRATVQESLKQAAIKEAAEKAAAAKKAASVNVQRRGAPASAPAKAGSIDDTIRNTYRNLVG